MTMQVSKGQFDRTTKLLEQKIRENSNNLISKLHAETEAFIEQLKQTNLDIDNLRQQIIDAGGETEDIEERLSNLVTSFENYRANMSRIDAAFDANGQFDGSKIQPLTVDTAALSVGQRSQQLTLSGIKFEVANYDINGNQFIEQGSSVYETGRGKLKYNAGQLFHYGFGTETNGPKIYSIAASSLIMSTTDLYYIYAKLPKDNSNTALISIDTRQITVEGKNNGTIIDNNNYYIQLGYISIELSSSNGTYKKSRKVDMTYGQTTINGRLITTGRIEGTTGTNPAYFDLDTGEIGGSVNKITVGSGSSTAGMMKDGNSNIAIWSGTETPSFGSTPIWITREGKAKFGNIGINNSNDDAIGFYNYTGSGTINPGSFLIRKDGTGYFGNLNINTDGHLLSTKKTIATNTPLFYINNDGTARFGDILLNNNILSFATSPLSINSSEYNFKNSYSGSSISGITFEYVTNAARSGFIDVGENYLFYFSANTYISGSYTYEVQLREYDEINGQIIVQNVLRTGFNYSSITIRRTLSHRYARIFFICTGGGTSISISNINSSKLIINAANGLNIYSNGIIICYGWLYIFFGIYESSFYTFTLQRYSDGTITRKDFNLSQ